MKVFTDQELQSQIAPRNPCNSMVHHLLNLLKKHGLEAPAYADVVITPLQASRHDMQEISLTGNTGLTASVIFKPYKDSIIVAAAGGCIESEDWYAINVPIADDRYDRFLGIARRNGI